MSPRYSVLLPTHDRVDVVGFAIRSVLAQTEQDFELLVVGDGCTDDTGEVVRAFKDPRIRWFDLPKAPGFGYANRNVALREARGELIGFMAHDDLMLPDHLEILAKPFTEARVEWAYSRPLWISDSGAIVPFAFDLKAADQLDSFLNERNVIPASCVVYRRSCIDTYGAWPETQAASGDWAYWKTILRDRSGANLAYVPEATVLHFRADWRSIDAWGPRPMHAWLRAADDGWWPQALKVEIPGGESPQGATWHVIEQGPSDWTAAVREGVTAAIDGLAWRQGITLAAIHESVGIDPLARVAQADAIAADARTRAERGSARAADATAELDALRREHSAVLDHLGRASPVDPPLEDNPLFDATWYLARYPDVGKSGMDPFGHWQWHGFGEGRDPNRYFVTHWYLERNPDVHSSGVDPLEHFYLAGGFEGRSPGPSFDTAWYVTEYADVRASGINPLLHYLTIGQLEQRLIKPPHPPGSDGPKPIESSTDRDAKPLHGE